MAATDKGGTAAPAAPPAPPVTISNVPQTAPGVSLAPGVAVGYNASGTPTSFVASPFASGVKGSVGVGADGSFQQGSLSPTAPAPDKGGSAAPAGPAGPTATVPVAGGVEKVPLDPRDAQYWAEKAQRDFTIAQQRAKYQYEGEADQRNYAEALRQLAMAQPKQEQSAKENYNKAGLFYSGKLGEALNTLAQSYASRRATAQTELADRERARAAARAALDAGYPIEDAAAYAAAVDRQVGRDTDAADQASLVANPIFAAPAPATTVRAPATTSMTKPKVVVKNGSVYHYYPDGRKVYVRPAR